MRDRTPLDPRLRVAGAAVFAGTVVALREPAVLGGALALAVALAVAVRLPPMATLKRMLAMDAFVLLMLLMLPFTQPGEEWFRLGGLVATREGGMRALEIAIKANAAVLALLALVGPLEIPVLGQALHRLRVPAKLIHLMVFTARYIEVLEREYRRLRLAMRARAFRPRSDLHTWRSFGYLFGMLLVLSLERSERILAAMKCRGFDGHFPVAAPVAFQARDALSALCGILVLAGLLWLDRT